MNTFQERRYGEWVGNLDGVPEDTARCAASVRAQFRPGGHQCCRNRGHGKDGLYCKQHAKRHPTEAAGGNEPSKLMPNQ